MGGMVDPVGQGSKAPIFVSDYSSFGDYTWWKLLAINTQPFGKKDYAVVQAKPGTAAYLKAISDWTEKHGCSRNVYLSGHGAGAGIGVATVHTGDWAQEITQNSPEIVIKQIRNAVCEGGTLHFCSCDAEGEDNVRKNVTRWAVRLGKGIKVCACSGDVYPPCRCDGKRICRRHIPIPDFRNDYSGYVKHVERVGHDFDVIGPDSSISL